MSKPWELPEEVVTVIATAVVAYLGREPRRCRIRPLGPFPAGNPGPVWSFVGRTRVMDGREGILGRQRDG